MPSKKNLLVVLLTLTTLTGGILAWQQHQALLALRADQDLLAREEREAFEKKLLAAQRHARDLESQLAGSRGSVANATDDPENSAAGQPPGQPGARRQGRGNNNRDGMAAFLENPEVAKLMSAQQRAGLDGRYADLFKKLKLSPAELEKFKDLLVERENSRRDVMLAANAEGLNGRENRDEIRKLIDQTNTELDASIQASLGAEKYAQYKQYEQTQPQRNLVGQLDQRLGYTGASLSDTQSEQLVQILATTSANARAAAAAANGGTQGDNQPGGGRQGGPGGGGLGVVFGGGFGGGGRGVSITDEAIVQAQAVLSPAQVTVLRDLQTEQKNQAQLNQLMRSQFQNREGGANAGTTTTTAPTSNTSQPTTQRKPRG